MGGIANPFHSSPLGLLDSPAASDAAINLDLVIIDRTIAIMVNYLTNAWFRALLVRAVQP